MKRINALLVLLCLLCCLVGCFNDPYKGKRPKNYGDARWVCSSPEVYFDIQNSDDAYDWNGISGLLKYNKQDIKIWLEFEEDGDGVWFNDDEKDLDKGILFYGTCEFSPEKMVVKIEPKKDKFFDGKVDELVFVRTELPDDMNNL